MSKATKAIPDGYHAITPGFAARGVDKAIEFYQRVFDAVETVRMPGPDGSVMHCEMRIGDSVFMCGEPMKAPYSMNVMLYVEDCDAVVKRAVEAGATLEQEVVDHFYGDRGGRVVDPFGNSWFIATHKEDLTPAEITQRMAALFAGNERAGH